MEKLKNVTAPAQSYGAPASAQALERKLEEYERWFKTLDSQLRSLERERQKFSAVVNHTDAGFLTLDSSLKVIWTNDVCRQWFRIGEKIGIVINARCCEVLCGKADFCQACPALKPLQSGTAAHSEMEIESSGKTRHLYITAIPIKLPDGRVEEVIVMLQDVTDLEVLKESRRALEKKEKEYRLLFENNPNPMWVYDLETLRFLAVNDAAVTHYDYSREDFLNMTIANIRPAEEVPALLENVSRVTEGVDRAGVWKHRKKDGTLIDAEITSHTLVFNERRAEVVLVSDVTERSRLESQLRQSQKMEAIGQLAGGIAHDFNNLLTAITGNCELLLKQPAADGSIPAELEEIKKAAERAATLTRQLLAFSRKQLLTPAVLDLNGIVSGMEMMLTRLIGENVQLAAVCRPNLWPVKVDASQMEQVILNLAVNARDAMPQGGRLTIETDNFELDVSSRKKHFNMEPGCYVMLTVSDSGCGMSAEIQKRAFEPFFTTKEKGRGTGLGLSTVYGIIKQSSGYIWIQSEPGRGTSVKIYLPRAQAADPPAQPQRALLSSPSGNETILLVEDEEAVRALASKALSKCGYRVLEAKSGDEAVILAGGFKEPIHLLLTDVIMPGMGGPELSQKLGEKFSGLKVLFISGYTDNAPLKREILASETPFLQKPFTLVNLARKVREVLDAKG